MNRWGHIMTETLHNDGPASPGRTRRRVLALAGVTAAAGTIMVLSSLGNAASAAQAPAAAVDPDVTLCHRTDSETNPYNQITIDAAGAFDGHLGHEGTVWFPGHPKKPKWGDIIPPFTYNGNTYSLNWDADGMAIFNNGCNPVTTTPTNTVTSTATVTQTVTQTVTATATATVTAPGSTVTVTAPGSTQTVTAPGSTVTVTAPGSTQTVTAPGSTVTVTAPGSTRIVTLPGTTETVTLPGTTETVTNPETTTETATTTKTESQGVGPACFAACPSSSAAGTEAVGPIPGGVDAGLHTPVSHAGVRAWGTALLLLGGLVGLMAGLWPVRKRAH
jgi:hypothetical protein